MDVKEFFKSIVSANSVLQVEQKIAEFEETNFNNFDWVPVGSKENNRGVIEVSADPGRSLIERVTNGIDALLDAQFENHNGIPVCKNPKEAASAWFNIPINGLAELSPGNRRTIAQQIHLRILPGEGKTSRVVEVRDYGIGLTPEQMPKTILSLNEGNKLQKHHLVGLYGQGGSSTFAVSKYTLIVSRFGNTPKIGFTIVKYLDLPPDEYKTGHYVYIVNGDGILNFELPIAEFPNGTLVKHFGYDLNGYPSPLGPNSVYGLLNSILFDPILPVWLDNQAIERPSRRVIKGSRNALNGAIDEGDDNKRGPELSHFNPMFYVDLGDYGRIGIEYWVLQQKAGKENKNPIASFVNPNKPVILTLNGQSHEEFSKILIKKDADLPFLSRRFIGHIDCNSLSPAAKRALFVSNREGARGGFVFELIQNEFIKALKSDDELTRLNNEARIQDLQAKDETITQKIRNEVASILQIQGFEILSSSGSLPSNDKHKSDHPSHPRKSRPKLNPIETHEPPTYIRIIWEENAKISFYPEQRRYLRVETDANSTYHNSNKPELSQVNIISSNGVLKYCGSSPLQNGRMRIIFECSPDAKPETEGTIRIELTRKGLPVIFDEKPFKIVETPSTTASRTKLSIPPLEFQEVDPNDQLWLDLEWPEDPKQIASSAQIENDGKLWIYYSSVFPSFASKKSKFERKDQNLAKSFIERYQIWLAVHSLLLKHDSEKNEQSIISEKTGSEMEKADLVEENERKERCRVAIISAMIAEKQVENQLSQILDEK